MARGIRVVVEMRVVGFVELQMNGRGLQSC